MHQSSCSKNLLPSVLAQRAGCCAKHKLTLIDFSSFEVKYQNNVFPSFTHSGNIKYDFG
jgi:hypothetical protein